MQTDTLLEIVTVSVMYFAFALQRKIQLIIGLFVMVPINFELIGSAEISRAEGKKKIPESGNHRNICFRFSMLLG